MPECSLFNLLMVHINFLKHRAEFEWKKIRKRRRKEKNEGIRKVKGEGGEEKMKGKKKRIKKSKEKEIKKKISSVQV